MCIKLVYGTVWSLLVNKCRAAKKNYVTVRNDTKCSTPMCTLNIYRATALPQVRTLPPHPKAHPYHPRPSLPCSTSPTHSSRPKSSPSIDATRKFRVTPRKCNADVYAQYPSRHYTSPSVYDSTHTQKPKRTTPDHHNLALTPSDPFVSTQVQ